MGQKSVKALVTGGSSGIGRAVATRLAASGGRVAILDLPRSAGSDVAAELGRQCHFIAADVTDEQSVEDAVRVARERMEGINTLVSCAGISDPTPVLDKQGQARPLDRFRKVVEVNLIGLYNVLRHSAEAMAGNEADAEGQRGVIVNLSSIAAYDGQIGQSAYSASKGAIASMTLPLARELAAQGIRVMTICPGIMDTPMLAGMSDTVRERLTALPVFPPRLGRPEELAELVVSCLDITYLNGTVIRMDAGTRMPAR